MNSVRVVIQFFKWKLICAGLTALPAYVYILTQLTIVDNMGRVVMQKEVEMGANGPFELDISAFSPGIYYVEFESDEGQDRQKLVVE